MDRIVGMLDGRACLSVSELERAFAELEAGAHSGSMAGAVARWRVAVRLEQLERRAPRNTAVA